MGCRQPDIPEAQELDIAQWLRVAEASLNGLRSNPASAGLPAEEAARIAAEDATALLRRAYDEEP